MMRYSIKPLQISIKYYWKLKSIAVSPPSNGILVTFKDDEK